MGKDTKNSFLKHFAVIGGGTALNLIVGLLATPVITRLVEPTEYGQLSIFNMYTSIAVMVICIGMDQALMRYFYEQQDIKYRRALLFRCIKLPIIVCFGLATAFVALTKVGLIPFEFSGVMNILLCINIAIHLVYRFSQLLVRLAYRSKVYSALNILQKILYVSFSLVFILSVAGHNLIALAVATVLSTLICLCVSVLIQKDMWSISKNNDGKCHISWKELLRYAYPYIFSMGITMFFQVIDKLSLNYYHTYNEVGIYSSAMTLIHVFNVIQTAFNALWAPMAVEHYANDKEDRKLYQQGNRIITVSMFFIGISLILCKDVFAVLLGEKYREAAYILPFLIFSPMMNTISETTVSGMVFMKKSGLQIIVAIGACATNIIGNTLLVPGLGCQGAAISTGISYIVFFTLRTVISNRYFYVDFKLKKFYLLTVVVVAYAFYNTFSKFNVGSVIGYVICLTVLILLYGQTVIWGINYLLDSAKDFIVRYRKNSVD